MLNRRHFLGATTSAFAGLALSGCSQTLPRPQGAAGRPDWAYGPLVRDPAGLIDLPQGFGYRIISTLGEAMADGLRVPDYADGMGCFALDRDRVILVRNHELNVAQFKVGPYLNGQALIGTPYDHYEDGSALPGGTTTLVYNLKTGRTERQHLSLSGTIRNCAGGTTPWGSWLSCEENTTRKGEHGVSRDHGYVFEVPARAKGVVTPVPLKAMGRFEHEACAVDPRTGIVYLTEDKGDGLLYRFLPNAKGELVKGGRLQCLGLADTSIRTSHNWNGVTMPLQQWMATRWIDLDDVESPNDDLRKRGAAKGGLIFARGEGVHFGNNEIFFTCTSGGAAKFGQVMRYRLSRFEGQNEERGEPGQLELFVESQGAHSLNYGDNLTVAPNGHLIICEDQYTEVVDNYLRGVTPAGELYEFARLRTQTELAGACFSPDGTTMFVNIFSPTKTIAITGPWTKFRG